MNKHLFLFVLFLINYTILFPQTRQFYFQHLGLEEGLSQSSVLCIIQDKKGFMWFGTKEGLNRYDGSNFRIFSYNPNDTTSLGNNVVNALYEDEKGILWVGTDNGVYLYNPRTEAFSLLNSCSINQEKITHPVYKFISDHDNNIWIIVESQGIFCFNKKTQQLKHYIIPNSEQISTLSIDQHNTIWIGYKEKGLYYTTDTFKSLKPFLTNDNKNPFADDRIFSIHPELQNTLYIGSEKGGLKKINTLTHDISSPLSASNKDKIFVRYIYPINKNFLFIGTERGLYVYDKISDNYQHISHNPNDIYSLSDNAIYAIYEDREGGIWIGSYFGGIDYFQTSFSIFEKYYPITGNEKTLKGRVVREICEDNNGNLWIGTEDGGLNFLDIKTGEIQPYILKVPHHNIHALCIDDQTLWIGTFSQGLYKLNIKTQQIQHYSKGYAENSLHDNSVYSMCHTSSGKLYLGTSNGLSVYNPITDDFTHIPKLNGAFVYNILEDQKGNIWFATYNAGIFKYNPINDTWKHYTADEQTSRALAYNKIISIYEDHNQNLWFCTHGKGIYIFDSQKNTFKEFIDLQGLTNNVIYKIIESENNIFWMTSNKGLIRLDLNKKTWTVYTKKNGLLTNQFNYCSGIKSTNGKIYLGSIKGLIAFDPKQLPQNFSYPPIVITDFLLFNKKVNIGKNSILQNSIDYTKEINLNYNQNSFSLCLTTLCYSTTENNRICYKLEGFDNEWYTKSKDAIATYTNLSPGNYTFCVKSANELGKWNNNITKISIKISPPIWCTTEAYIFYILCFIGVVGFFFYYQRKLLNKKHLNQLKILTTEKEKEIYQAQIKFFTTIAHEIRTPLTLIKGPLDNIMKEGKLDKVTFHENLLVMERNTQRLLDLVNQLLDFRKTEISGYHLYYMRCNVSQLIKDTYTRFYQFAQQNGFIFTIELPEEDFYAPIDKEIVTKILSNLFDNAIKYAECYIHVSLIINKEKESFTISICNGGTPIPYNMRDKIFEPFVQIRDSINNRNIISSGIGLPLAKSLAELHQGSLYLKDQDEICFCLTLPLRQEITIQLYNNSDKVVTHTNSLSYTEKCILVVEDDKEMLSFICNQIGLKYRTVRASNGKEALEILQQNNLISLIVSDIMMPQMDGLELCQIIKSNIEFSHIPIILLTAKTAIQSKIKGIELGANDYIEKPFSIEYLLARITNLIDNQENMRKSFISSPFTNAQSIALSKTDVDFLERLTDIIQKHLSDPEFNVDTLAEKIFMSRSSLHRKIKNIAQITPNEFIQLERLKTAAKLIQSKEYKINEICYLVGFNSPSYFSKCFQKHFGLLPKEFVNNVWDI